MNYELKKLFLAVLGLLLVSCEDDFDISRLHDNPQLLVYCFPTEGDSTVVEVLRTMPLDAGGSSSFRVDASVTYKVNGIEVPVRRITAADCIRLSADTLFPTKRLEGQYCAIARQKAGDRIEVEVRAEGLPVATAATTIPASVEARVDSVVTGVTKYDDSNLYNRITATFADASSADDYYMVRIAERRLTGMALGRDSQIYGDQHGGFQALSYTDYLAHKDEFPYWDFSQLQWSRRYVYLNTGSDPVFENTSKIDEDFGFDPYEYYDMAYFFTDRLFNGGSYTLRLDAFQHRSSLNTHYAFGLWDEYAGGFYYVMELYRLSREYYRFLKSRNDRENNFWAENGLTSGQTSYTNVHGGLGIVAGYAVTTSARHVEVKTGIYTKK